MRRPNNPACLLFHACTFTWCSIKEICSSSSCLTDDLLKRCLFKYAICSNSWIIVSLSRLFNLSTVYFKAMPLPPSIHMVLLFQNFAGFANQDNAHAFGCAYKAVCRCYTILCWCLIVALPSLNGNVLIFTV